MNIIGAGYAGLLAGAILPNTTIYEAGTEVQCSQKHQAVFRMRTDRISKFLGIEFKKVLVIKDIWFQDKSVISSPALINMYSKKVAGNITNRSIWDTKPTYRFIPPKNFYQELQSRNNVCYNYPYSFAKRNHEEPLISTAPLNHVLLQLGAKYLNSLTSSKPELPAFKHQYIYVSKYLIKNCNTYMTVYYPGPETSAYRATITGSELIIESISPMHLSQNGHGMSPDILSVPLISLGLSKRDISETICSGHEQEFGKIVNIDEKIRSALIYDLTVKYNIYSLGRYATWRQGLLMEDVFNDIFVIRRLIQSGEYAAKLYNQNK